MVNIDTPKWDFKLVTERNVYEPAEDSFLLLDALERDIENISKTKPSIILEIGSGSGIIISAVASQFKNNIYCFAVDINPNACFVTKNTSKLNNIEVDVIQADLLTNFRLHEVIDIIIMNPPYVGTTDEESAITGISQSWAGGEYGRKIIERLLPVVNKALSTNGIFYLVTISSNNIEKICEDMKIFGFENIILMERQVRGELLYVLKFKKLEVITLR